MSEILAPLMLFLSLAALRHQVIGDMGLDYSQASQLGVWFGYSFDFLAALIPTLGARLLWGLGKVPMKITWPLLTLPVWCSAYANVTYFRFFEGRLQWWIVQYYSWDIVDSRDSIGELGFEWIMLLSLVLFLGSSFVAFRYFRSKNISRKSASRLGAVGATVGLLLALVGLKLSDRWYPHSSPMLSQHIYQIWVESLVRSRSNLIPNPPSAALAQYREWPSPNRKFRNSNWPLMQKLQYKPMTSHNLRAQLGLPLDQPLNVVVLFIESFRAFEVNHPELGHQIFPRFKEVVQKHGVYFRQAYTSAGIAGMTVRGQFSTICSKLPNMMGPGTFLAYEDLRIQCLPQVFRQNGYQTTWFHSLSKSYHNAEGFENKHGTDHFYDSEYFRKRGITKSFRIKGVADRPFLQETLRVLRERSKEGPVFANILTISSHHPFVVIPEGELPSEISQATAKTPEYQGYLSKLRYTDEAIGEFTSKLFESEIGDHTVLIVLGDHGVTLRPHYELTPLQEKELRYRIPLAILTKKMHSPQEIKYPVHQVDIAPTIAAVTGISGMVTWVGKNLFDGEGSPWVTLEESGIAYRTKSRACYSFRTKAKPQCWSVFGDTDPMADSSLLSLQEDPSETEFFRSVVLSNTKVISSNLIAPENANDNVREDPSGGQSGGS